ncbi:MAG: hypothetical protein WD939_05605 [Dehalococcoidia bacterium]
METYGRTWALCGGWAVDAWLGRPTRDHGDVDIAVFQDDHRALFEHLTGWQLVAHPPNWAGDTSELWDGRRIDIPGHVHGRFGDEPMPESPILMPEDGFTLDIQINERSGGEWAFCREPRITLALERAIGQSRWGLPTLTPEGILLYKSGVADVGDVFGFLRRRDKLDFVALLPQLASGQRDWLREALVLAGHPWLSQLAS